MRGNEIRGAYETRINELVSDWEMFATGAYLSEGEAENWCEPLDANRIPAVHEALKDFLIASLDNPNDPQRARTELLELYKKLHEINSEDTVPVVEQEEIDDLENVLRDFYQDTGLSQDVISALPAYEDYLDALDEDESY